MKRILAIFLVLITVFSLNACNLGKDPKSIYNGDKQVISLGMSRADVEKVLGSGQKESAQIYFYDKLSIMVEYEGNITVGIFVSQSNKYSDYLGNKVGDDYIKCKSSYAEKNIKATTNTSLVARFDKNKKIIKNKDASVKSDFIIVYQTDKKNHKKITNFMINERYY